MFKFITGQDALLKQRREMEAVKAKQISGDEVNSIVFVTLSETSGSTTDSYTNAFRLTPHKKIGHLTVQPRFGRKSETQP